MCSWKQLSPPSPDKLINTTPFDLWIPAKQEASICKKDRTHRKHKKGKELCTCKEYFTKFLFHLDICDITQKSIDGLCYRETNHSSNIDPSNKMKCDGLQFMIIHKYFNIIREIMASKVEKRKVSKAKKKDDVEVMHPATKPTSEEIAIAKWIKANVPCKKTKFLSHSVEYFTASKAVDKLLISPWSSPGKNKEEPLFTTRESVVQYLDFHAEEKKDKGKKEKRKIRLDMHLEQIFVDGNDAYVWIYDPIPYYYWLAGGGVVLAVVALCLFPLWPPVVRKGVYYLSIGAAGFLMFIFGLAVLRVLIFCLLWLVSMGRHHLWIFPNLTEDVGFFASFWPLWKYECRDKESPSKKDKKNNGKKKLSDDENEEKAEESGGEDTQLDNIEDTEDKSETESEQTGKDFEMIEKDDE
uniref:Translocation protein SEC62 n=1 Tax=Daphnia magna TaxID=35525 RepID=A0A4Y7MSG4_9CRUS|nr:EOG090X0D00 [Daphnia magna]